MVAAGLSGRPRLLSQLDKQVMNIDALSLLRSLPAGSVSCFLTDPPYGIDYYSGYYKNGNPHNRIASDAQDFDILPFMVEMARALCDGGAIYICTRFDIFPAWAATVSGLLTMKNVIVWKKDNWSAGDLTGNFGFQHELIMFLVKGRHVLRGRRWSNVWEFPRVAATRLQMPAEKPVALFERAIEASSDRGGLIVDPFCGCGTTAEAAMYMGRRFVVGDIDPKMVAITRQRVGLPGAVVAVKECGVTDPPDGFIQMRQAVE